MTDTSESPAGKAQRQRSPSFPFISLEAAIERLKEFDEKFPRQEVPADRAYLAWGMKGDTSQAQQTLAALKAFGLIEYRGIGPKRPTGVSADARTYLRAQQDSIKQDILKRVALHPKWVAFFWPKWGTNTIPDEIRLDQLVLDHKFNENTAPQFLRVYDDTIKFAGLTETDKTIAPDPESEEDDDGPGDDPASERKDDPPLRKRVPAKAGMKEDIFTLKEGDVVLQWPERLSVDSYVDLEMWAQLMLRKIKRSVEAESRVQEEFNKMDEYLSGKNDPK
ncbi:MAG: hypothetical protein AB7M12_01785 [Hyphomonadaceae bacterium]